MRYIHDVISFRLRRLVDPVTRPNSPLLQNIHLEEPHSAADSRTLPSLCVCRESWLNIARRVSTTSQNVGRRARYTLSAASHTPHRTQKHRCSFGSKRDTLHLPRAAISALNSNQLVSRGVPPFISEAIVLEVVSSNGTLFLHRKISFAFVKTFG